MTDILSPAQRSERMSLIKCKNTQPELLLRKLLHRQGLRFRLHRSGLPGRPDLVFPRFKAVVFVHGCFWHHHQGCKMAGTPKSNTEFWVAKFDRNTARDAQVSAQLMQQGWRVFTTWECELSSARKAQAVAERLAIEIRKS